jgi:hypothetical protein
MITRSITGLLAIGAAAVLALPASAETVKTGGTVCWTGEIEYISTSKKDMAWVWKLDWTFVSDDKDPKRGGSGKCFGSGGMIAGKPETSASFCKHNPVGGGKYMSRAVGGAKGNKGAYFGGIKEMAGISGSYVGGPLMRLPAEKGEFSACRQTNGEYTLAK